MGPVVFSVGVALSTARLESQELSPKQREGPEVPGAGRGGRAQSWRREISPGSAVFAGGVEG